MSRLNGSAPGWPRLWRHSYRLFASWLLRGAPRAGLRVAVTRLLVPMDPWRYYELGRLADEQFAGRCLDVSSPKLLTSLFEREGQADWTGIDLYEREIQQWQAVDPRLRVEVADATCLPYDDDSFDTCICVSVLEHIPDDHKAMAEMWRVLRPGGALHLTIDIAQQARDVYVGSEIYGEASPEVGGRVFFEHIYGAGEIDGRLLGLPWVVEHREYVRQRDERWERWFYGLRPWSYPLGGLLRLVCAHNFEVSASVPDLVGRHHGVVYLRLRKPLG
jgi:SAM-dependent methyltransferase